MKAELISVGASTPQSTVDIERLVNLILKMVSVNLLSFVLIITALARHASGCYNLPCIPGWYPWRDHCYLVYPPPEETKWFTFDQGEEFCKGFQNKQVKGHLVSILDQEEQDFVIRLMSKIRPEGHFWIGLTDAAVEG